MKKLTEILKTNRSLAKRGRGRAYWQMQAESAVEAFENVIENANYWTFPGVRKDELKQKIREELL